MLCELYAVGYSTATLDALPKIAEPLDGETCTFFCHVRAGRTDGLTRRHCVHAYVTLCGRLVIFFPVCAARP